MPVPLSSISFPLTLEEASCPMVTAAGILRHSLSLLHQQKCSNKHNAAPLAAGSFFTRPQAEGFVSHTSINHKAQDNSWRPIAFKQHVDTHISWCRAVTWAHLTICSLPPSPPVAQKNNHCDKINSKISRNHKLLVNQYSFQRNNSCVQCVYVALCSTYRIYVPGKTYQPHPRCCGATWWAHCQQFSWKLC